MQQSPKFKLSKVAQALSQTSLKTTGKKIATVSDIHLHHDRVPAQVIIASLMREFPDNEETAELDAIIIAGDLFDKIMYVGSDNPDYALIHAWMVVFLEMCSRLEIAVRILEGTPSHDRGQSKMMENINNDFELAGMKKADLRYFDTVTVDWDDTLGMHILYVPDEVHPSPDKVWEYVSQALSVKGLTQVDIGVMHGMFDYQAPLNIKLPTHDSARYSQIVRYFITVGHIHIASNKDNIYAQGSLERLSHNEEGAKGHYRFHVENGTYTAKFIENKKAVMQKTVDIRHYGTGNLASMMSDLEESFGHITFGFLRLFLTSEQKQTGITAIVADMLPNLKVTEKLFEEKVVERETDDSYKLPTLTPISPSSIIGLMEAKLGREDLTPLFKEIVGW